MLPPSLLFLEGVFGSDFGLRSTFELEGFGHWDVDLAQVMDKVVEDSIGVFDHSGVHVVHDAQLGKGVRRLNLMDHAHFAIDIFDLDSCQGVTFNGSVVGLHLGLGGEAHVLLRAQRALCNDLLGAFSYLVKRTVSLLDLVAEGTRLVRVSHQVLDSRLLSILRAEVVPLDLGDVEEAVFLVGHFDLFPNLFLDLFTCEQLPLPFDELVPFCLREIVHSSGCFERLSDLLCLNVVCLDLSS